MSTLASTLRSLPPPPGPPPTPSQEPLDFVDDPVLGRLAFPQSMPYEDRNASVQRILSQRQDFLGTDFSQPTNAVPSPPPAAPSPAPVTGNVRGIPVHGTEASAGSVPILDAPITGFPQLARGLREGTRPPTMDVPSDKEAAAADVIEGAFKALEPLTAPAMALNPVPSMLALGVGGVGAAAGKVGTELAGGGPSAQRLGEDVGGGLGAILGGGLYRPRFGPQPSGYVGQLRLGPGQTFDYEPEIITRPPGGEPGLPAVPPPPPRILPPRGGTGGPYTLPDSSLVVPPETEPPPPPRVYPETDADRARRLLPPRGGTTPAPTPLPGSSLQADFPTRLPSVPLSAAETSEGARRLATGAAAAATETEQPRSDSSEVDRSKLPGGALVDPRSLNIDWQAHDFSEPSDVRDAGARIDGGQVPTALVHTDPATGTRTVIDGHGSAVAALERGVPVRAIEAPNVEGAERIGATVMSHFGAADRPDLTASIADDKNKPVFGQDVPSLEEAHNEMRNLPLGLGAATGRELSIEAGAGPGGAATAAAPARIPLGDTPETKTGGVPEGRAGVPSARLNPISQAAQNIVDLANKNGGATYSLTRGDLGGQDLHVTAGFYPEREEHFDRPITAADVESFIRKNLSILTKYPQAAVGIWQNHTLEISGVSPDEQLVDKIARQNDQVSRFHLGSFTETPTGGSGKGAPIGQRAKLEDLVPSLPQPVQQVQQAQQSLPLPGDTYWLVDTRNGRERLVSGDPTKVTPKPYEVLSRRNDVGQEQIVARGKRAFSSPPLFTRNQRGAATPEFLSFLSSAGLSEVGKSILTGLLPSKTIDGWADVARFLPAADRARVNRGLQQRVLDALKEMGDPKWIEEATKAGSSARGRYKRTGALIRDIFGRDSDRFVNFFAALSPIKTVEQNFIEAFNFHANWVRAGKPAGMKNAELIRSILPKNAGVAGAGIREQLYNILVNDAEPSGPKVSAFAKNLRGDMQAITKDRLMAYLFGLGERGFGVPGGAKGLAADVMIRAVSKKLGMLPAEVQESGWSFIRTVLSLVDKGATPSEAARTVTEAQVRAGGSELAALIANNPKVRASLDELAARTGNPAFSVSNIERSGRYQQLLAEAGRARGIAGGLRGADREVLANVAERASLARSGPVEGEGDTAEPKGEVDTSFNPEEFGGGEVSVKGPGRGSIYSLARPAAAPARETTELTLGPESKKLLKKFGTTSDPLKAGFILRDGSMVPLSTTHDQMLGGVPTDKLREKFIKNENAIRVRYRTGRGGSEAVLSVPEKITQQQLPMVRQVVASLSRTGNLVMENLSGRYARFEFPRMYEVENTLQSWGAHPDRKNLTLNNAQGWLMPNGKFEVLRPGEEHGRAAGRLGFYHPDSAFFGGLQAGAVRVARTANELTLTMGPPNEQNLALVKKAMEGATERRFVLDVYGNSPHRPEKIVNGRDAINNFLGEQQAQTHSDEDGSGATFRMSLNPLADVGRAYTNLVRRHVTEGALRTLVNTALGKLDLATGIAFKRALRDPDTYLPSPYRKLKTEARYETIKGAQTGLSLGQRLSEGIDQQTQKTLMDVLAGRATATQLQTLRATPRLQDALNAAMEARQRLDDLGSQAVIQGLLKDTTFFKNVGRYVPRLYRKYEVDYNDLLRKVGMTAPDRMDLSRFKKRDDIPPLVRLAMGEIEEPAYPVARGIADLSHDVAQAKFFSKVAANPEWAGDIQKKPGWIQLPETPKLGKLSGKWVDRDIARDANEMAHMPSEAARLWSDLWGKYKKVRVVWSPGSFVWHNLSRGMLNYLDGLPPSRLDIYAKALVEMGRKGPLYESALRNGAIDPHNFEPELFSDLIDSWNKSRGNAISRIAHMGADFMSRLRAGKDYHGDFLNHPWWAAMRKLNPVESASGGLSNKVTQAYMFLDQWMKVARYAHYLEKGMPEFDAATHARKATIDYRNVPKLVDWGRRTITPFITFPSRALPKLAKDTIEAPWRMLTILGLLAYVEEKARHELGISKEQDDQNRKLSRPEGVEGAGLDQRVGGFNRFLLLPTKDAAGNYQYLDLSHLLHWTGVGQPPAPGITPFGTESSLGPLQLPAEIAQRELYANPLVSMVGPVAFNKDPYTGKDLYGPGAPHEGPAGAFGERLVKTWTPSLFPGNFQFDQAKGAIEGRPDYFGNPVSPESRFAQLATGVNVRTMKPGTETMFRSAEFKKAEEEIQSRAYTISRDQRLSPAEHAQAMQDLEKRQAQLVSRWRSLFAPPDSQR